MLVATEDERKLITPLVDKYKRNRGFFEHLTTSMFNGVISSNQLRPLIHSAKYRTKDPGHLEDKLIRKLRKAKKEGIPFDIEEDNLFQKINDLMGVRILHLHTSQFPKIDPLLTQCLLSLGFEKIEGPIAKTWDNEYKQFFQKFEITTEDSKNQYTSVHYVFDAQNDLKMTAEVQVRTLAEELWGEVDHILNYPHKHGSVACGEQIAVLARITSGCTRLVDAIFRTDEEHKSGQENPVAPQEPAEAPQEAAEIEPQAPLVEFAEGTQIDVQPIDLPPGQIEYGDEVAGEEPPPPTDQTNLLQ